MGCEDESKRIACENSCIGPNTCQTVGKECQCVPTPTPETFNQVFHSWCTFIIFI